MTVPRHQKSALAGRRPKYPRRPQHGAALLIFMILVVTAALTYMVTNLTPEAVEARRMQQTSTALTQAREALIGYALKYRDEQISQGQFDRVYGYLPLPDLGSSRNNNAGCTQEGCDAANFAGNALNATVIGRLPWRTLGLPPLRDGANECLWYAVSGSHQRQQRVTPMNWDTLGHLDIVVANGSDTLASLLASPHDRPVAVIFAPGPPLPGQDRSAGGDVVNQCGGNYDAANYLDPVTATALGGITNYLAGSTNNASGVTGDSNPDNDPDTPKALLTQGKVFADNGNFLSGSCSGADCTLAANDSGLMLTSEHLFAALRKSAHFRNHINGMLHNIGECLRDEIAAGGTLPLYGKIAGANDNNCYGDLIDPAGYYSHYREMIFVATPASTLVSADGATPTSCEGALLFSGQRDKENNRCPESSPTQVQRRTSTAERNDYCNYLEGDNLVSFTTAGNLFSGASLFDRSDGATAQAIHQDIVKCIPTGATQQTISLDLSARFPTADPLATYSPATRTLTLGADNVQLASNNADAGKLFGCSWASDAYPRGNGFRSYFRFKIRNVGDGFTFAIVDDLRNRNPSMMYRCGSARQHLGYSGNNGYTHPIDYPKIAIEFDTARNYSSLSTTGYYEPGNTLRNGRNDPCYRSSCPLPNNGLNNDSHVAVMYWGYESLNSDASVSAPSQDDNVHGFPLSSDYSPRPSPRNATAVIPHPSPAPYPPLAIAPLERLRNTTMINRDFHVRVEVTPMTPTVADQAVKRRSWKIEAWVVATSAKEITGLAWSQDTDAVTGLPKESGTVVATVPSHGFGEIGKAYSISIRDAPVGVVGDYTAKILNTNQFSFSKYPNPGSLALSGQPVAMKITDQVQKMRTTSLPMTQLSPVVKYGECTTDADCAASQSCSGTEADGKRYCYAGHQPTVFDQQYIYDIDLGDGNYHEAFQLIRLGFTIGVGTNDQVIDIQDFRTQWLP